MGDGSVIQLNGSMVEVHIKVNLPLPNPENMDPAKFLAIHAAGKTPQVVEEHTVRLVSVASL